MNELKYSLRSKSALQSFASPDLSNNIKSENFEKKNSGSKVFSSEKLHNVLEALASTSKLNQTNNPVNGTEDNNSSIFSSPIIENTSCSSPENNILPTEMAPPQQVTNLSFIGGDEIKKFVGNPTHFDTMFTPGPPINEFLDNFNAFCQRHNLASDADKLTALKINMHPSMGDSRFILASILDENLNTNITFDEVINYLKRAYKPTSSINVYRASQNFINLCRPKASSDNDFLKLRQIEIAARELLEAFTKRPAYVGSEKSDEQKMLEILSLTAYSAYAGEKISKKLSESSVPARELLIKCTEELRLQNLKEKSENLLYYESKQQPETNTKQFGFKNNSYKKMNTDKNKNNLICHKCALGGHSARECKSRVELFCSKCLKSGHVSKVCFSKQLFRNSK